MRNAGSNTLGIADPRLAAIVRAWPDLPEPIRAGIAVMIGSMGLNR